MGRAHNVDLSNIQPQGAYIYFRSDGSLKRIGDTVVNPDMAGTLRLIAAEGADVFYRRVGDTNRRGHLGPWRVA